MTCRYMSLATSVSASISTPTVSTMYDIRITLSFIADDGERKSHEENILFHHRIHILGSAFVFIYLRCYSSFAKAYIT